MGQKARDVIKAGLSVAVPNYPEYLGKSHLTNVPWFFHMIWGIIKSFLDGNTLAKISLNGSDFIKALKDEIAYESIPQEVGGGFLGSNRSFDFDISEGGPLWYPGAPLVKISYDTIGGLDSGKRRSRSSSIGNFDLSIKRLSGAGASSPLGTPLAISRKRSSSNISDKVKKRLSNENMVDTPVALIENVTPNSEVSDRKDSSTNLSDTKSNSNDSKPVATNSIKSFLFVVVTNPIISCVYALVLLTVIRSINLIVLVLLPIASYYILQLLE